MVAVVENGGVVHTLVHVCVGGSPGDAVDGKIHLVEDAIQFLRIGRPNASGTLVFSKSKGVMLK